MTDQPTRTRRRNERGQIVVIFAGALVVILAMAGLLIDGGFLLSANRQAQAAADTGALAAAKAASTGANAATAARAIANMNGYPTNLEDCDGAMQAGQGVVVNRPPIETDVVEFRNSNYVEVITTRAEHTLFAQALGMPCFIVRARAVAQIGASEVATCSFCVLTEWGGDGSDNPFLMDNTGHLRVDGDILVNGKAINGASCSPSGAYLVCGKALHLYRTGGTPGDTTRVSARTISVAGGWESLGGTQARADALAEMDDGTPCLYHPDPNIYGSAGYPPSNVCVGMPPIDDPLAIIDPPDGTTLSVPVVGDGGCPASGGGWVTAVPTGSIGNPGKLTLTGTTPGGPFFTICPGLYFGGFSVVGNFSNVHVRMQPGIYFMVGGGFQVGGTASIDGSSGVMIYNSGGSQSFSHNTAPLSTTLPPCSSGSCAALSATMSGPPNTAVENPVTYTADLVVPSGQPLATGTVAFYDGDVLVPGCEAQPLAPVTATRVRATCSITYHEFGTRWITAEYAGDATYAAIREDDRTNVNPNAQLGIDDIDVCTGPTCGANGTCTTAGPCNRVILKAQSSGTYAGMLVFQDRSSSLGIRFWPDLGADPCAGSGSPPSWMTAGVPGAINEGDAVPDPCGPLGGMSGTIYAPHSRTGTGWDATVNIRADGVANLQIIAGRIALQYNNDMRFAYRPEEFANGAIRLVD